MVSNQNDGGFLHTSWEHLDLAKMGHLFGSLLMKSWTLQARGPFTRADVRNNAQATPQFQPIQRKNGKQWQRMLSAKFTRMVVK